MPTNSAQAATITIGFDEFSNFETISGDTFIDLGVVFDNSLRIFDGSTGALPQSQPNTAARAVPFAGDISGFFTETVDFISVFAGDGVRDIDTVTLLGFDEFDNIVASDTFSAVTAQTLSISGPGIARFEINNVGRIAIDDFTFNTKSVPEPVSVVGLLALGAVGAGSMLKRKMLKRK
ncbi:MAG: PEP-CTERM sorting domain-containing protein [Hormoscilla sp.]